MRILLRTLAVLLAALLLPAAVGTARGLAAHRDLYAPLDEAAGEVPAPTRTHDPDKPTAVVVVGAKGAEVSDVLGPFEVLAATEAFNLYTVAPERRPLPLTGGLHVVPDLTFDELDARLGDGGAADVVVVPKLPDVEQPTVAPVTGWLRQQAAAGALVAGVCSGAEVLASAGLLDGLEATSHWARMSALERAYPQVSWRRGTRYVEQGDIITTGGLLSSIDGSLRVVERLVGADAARRAAEAVGWRFYTPGEPAAMPVITFGPDAVLKPLNAAFRRGRVGVVLDDGVGEIELASAFDTYSGQSLAARTVAVTASGDAIVSRHGMVFVPASDLHRAGDQLDRLLVPGAEAARRRDPDLAAHAEGEHGLTPEYVHAEPGFPFESTLRDLARTVDAPTARWTAKLLEYPTDDLDLAGPAWPWGVTLPPLLLALVGLVAVLGLARALRRRSPSQPAPAPDPAPEVS